MTSSRKIRSVTMCLFLIVSLSLSAQTEVPKLNAEQTIENLYDLLSTTKGETPDWKKVSESFAAEAVVVLRSSRTSSSRFSRDGFVADFKKFFTDAKVIKTGFQEKIINLKSLIFGDIASISVIYETSFPGKSGKPQTGVDLIHLIKKDNKWLITSIINEVPIGDFKVPEILFKKQKA